MKPAAPSAIDCWMQTLNYAKQKDKIKTANFPCDKTFDRLLKKNILLNKSKEQGDTTKKLLRGIIQISKRMNIG